MLGPTGSSRYTPFLCNLRLVEMYKLRPFAPWILKGICALDQLQQNGSLMCFDRLREDFGLPHAWFYQYLQLRHAFSAQAQIVDLSIVSTPVLDPILDALTTKGTISNMFKSLLSMYLQPYPLRVRHKWEEEIGPISEQHWEHILEPEIFTASTNT